MRREDITAYSGMEERLLRDARGQGAPAAAGGPGGSAANPRAEIGAGAGHMTRDELELALRESEERFSAVERYLTDVIWISDLSLNIIYVSPSIFYQSGFTAQEALKMNVSELLTPDSFQKAVELYESELKRAGETDVFPPIPVELVVEQRRKDGSTFWSEVRLGFLRDAEGTPYGILGVSRDISERIRAQQAEREAAAARAEAEARERYAAELKEMVDIAAHELRLPATLFKGYAGALRRRRGQLREEELDSVLAQMEATADRLDRLVRDLLDTTLIENRRLQLELTDINPGELMRRAVDSVAFSGGEARVETVPFEEELTLRGDAEKLVRVLSALLDNALKYSPPLSPVRMWCEPGAGAVTFNVRDRGPGIPPEEREKVFERFYRGKPRGSRVGGMGLGLFLARKLAEAHGGRLWLEEGEGGGSLFRLRLPLGQAQGAG